MPFSISAQLSPILSTVEQLQPSTVLDVGVGMGQYGFLIRNNLEGVNLFETQGTSGWLRDRSQWTIKIDGIEGFRGYITPVHDYAYNSLLIGEALHVLRTLASESYDLVLAIDILEHFEHADGEDFVRECQRVSRRHLIVATPEQFVAQQVDANPLENHRSHWTKPELSSLGFNRFLTCPDSIIGVWSR